MRFKFTAEERAKALLVWQPGKGGLSEYFLYSMFGSVSPQYDNFVHNRTFQSFVQEYVDDSNEVNGL